MDIKSDLWLKIFSFLRYDQIEILFEQNLCPNISREVFSQFLKNKYKVTGKKLTSNSELEQNFIALNYALHLQEVCTTIPITSSTLPSFFVSNSFNSPTLSTSSSFTNHSHSISSISSLSISPSCENFDFSRIFYNDSLKSPLNISISSVCSNANTSLGLLDSLLSPTNSNHPTFQPFSSSIPKENPHTFYNIKSQSIYNSNENLTHHLSTRERIRSLKYWNQPLDCISLRDACLAEWRSTNLPSSNSTFISQSIDKSNNLVKNSSCYKESNSTSTSHHCSKSTCTFTSYPEIDLYICNDTGITHICDKHCKLAINSDQDYGFSVCPISGRMFENAENFCKEHFSHNFYDQDNFEKVIGDDDDITGFLNKCYTDGYNGELDNYFFKRPRRI